jgi:hypothetical protein
VFIYNVRPLPAAIADIACQNKAVVYDLLFKASAETMLSGSATSITKRSFKHISVVPLDQSNSVRTVGEAHHVK